MYLRSDAERAYDIKRAKRPDRRQKARAITIKWRKEKPRAYKAQTKLGNALQDGKIQKGPCIICNATKHIHAHHKDYEKPLEVTWLCARCHHRLHAKHFELVGEWT